MDIKKLDKITYELSDTISYLEVLLDYCEYYSENNPTARMQALLELIRKEFLRHLDDLENIVMKS